MLASSFEDCPLTCMVEAHSRKAGTALQGSCTGTWLDAKQGILLTHSTLIAPILVADKTSCSQVLEALKEGQLSAVINDFEVQIHASFSKPPSEKCSQQSLRAVAVSEDVSRTEQRTSDSKRTPDNLRTCQASVKHTWKNTGLATCLKSWFSSDEWKFDDPKPDGTIEGGKINDVELSVLKELLSYFLVLQVNDSLDEVQQETIIFNSPIQIGDPLFTVSCPFGNMCPAVFAGTVSSGIVSNICGAELLLTDARCLPGSEGGAVVIAKNNRLHLAGIIISPMCWKGGEWIGLTLVARMQDVLISGHLTLTPSPRAQLPLKEVLRSSLATEVLVTDLAAEDLHTDQVVFSRSSSQTALKKIKDRVVMVANRQSWGSGVLIQDDVIITCSHVVKGVKQVEVHVPGIACGCNAQVHYASPANSCWDFALLKISDRRYPKITMPAIDVAQAVPGAKVYVVGHSLFNTRPLAPPSLTAGVVGSVVQLAGQPIMIQSTCAVHAGASGGPMVDKDGRMVGLVVCNAKDVKTNSHYPHVNMSLPMATIWPHIVRYLSSQDKAAFDVLSHTNKSLSKLWALQNPTDGVLAHAVASKL